MIIQKFKKSNIVFFHGQNKTNKVYLVKSGELLRTQILEGRSNNKKKIGQGHFFGIKSGFGAKKVDETVQAITDCELYVLSSKEFLGILEKKTELIFLILKNFFGELRNSHKEIEKRMSSNDDEDDIPSKFLQIGSYFEYTSNYEQALYVYQKYLDIYPKSPNVDEIKDKIENVKNDAAAI